MQAHKPIPDILNAGQMTWFEADKVTLSVIKARYLTEAKEFLYFRKGEDWLKYLMDCLGALADGAPEMAELARVCGRDVLTFTNDHIASLVSLDIKKCIEWYVLISHGKELLKKDLRSVWTSIANIFVKRGPKKLDFRILCTDSQENRDHLSRWKARGTKVRFYAENQQAGSHRFYLNEKGYAVFWRQGKGDSTRFYGFEGSDPKVIRELRTLFEHEWKNATNS